MVPNMKIRYGATPLFTNAAITRIVRIRSTQNNFGRRSPSLSSSFSASTSALRAAKSTPAFFRRMVSVLPQITAAPRLMIRPKICIGIMLTQSSVASISIAVAARMVGPPHGTRFITPVERPTNRSRINGFNFIFLKIGSITGMVIRYVDAHAPSICATTAIKLVAIMIRVMLLPAIFTRPFTNGSNSPASFITLK